MGSNNLLELLGLDLRTLVLAVGTTALLAGVVLTWPLSELALWLYRRRVTAAMRRPAGPPATGAAPLPRDEAPAPVAAQAQRPAAPPWIAIAPPTVAARPDLVDRAAGSVRRAQLVLGVAGLFFGVASTIVYHVVSDLELLPFRFVTLVALLGWLVVPTVTATGRTPVRKRVLLWAGVAFVAVVLPTLGGTPLPDTLSMVAIIVGIPGLFLLATSGRRIRGAAWLLFPTAAVLAVVALTLYVPFTYLQVGFPFDTLAWGMVVAAVAEGLLLLGYATAGAALYARKVVSDETLLILQWWVVLAITQALFLGTQGWTDALGGLVPLVVMALVLVIAAFVRPRRTGARPVRLLLLRTFGSRRRSSRLLRDVTTHWRWVGSVELITGADLAADTLEPHEFVDFLLGRLRRRFVKSEDDLRRRLDDLDLRPDRDGRYRVNELLCHDDTWRPTLRALVGTSDAVLVDVRGLTSQNTGVVHEIEQLVAMLPLAKVVALVDATTDTRVLREALDRAAFLAPPESPLHDDPAPVLRTVAATGRRTADATLLLDALGTAAGHGTAARVARAAGASETGLTGSAPAHHPVTP